MKKLLSRENVAIVLSTLALLVSWLSHISNQAMPEFSLSHEVYEEVIEEDSGSYAILGANRIYLDLKNKGNAPAKNVRISVLPMYEYTKEPWVGINPNKEYSTRYESGILYINIPVLGKGEIVDIAVVTKPKHKDNIIEKINNNHPISYFQFSVNVDCDQGAYINRSIPVSLRRTETVKKISERIGNE